MEPEYLRPADSLVLFSENIRPETALYRRIMSRRLSCMLPGIPHHVTQRGNGRNLLFSRPGEYAVYLDLLVRQARDNGVALLGYCLLPYQLHLIVTPRSAHSLVRMIQTIRGSYASWLGTRSEQGNHCHPKRYHCAPLDSAQFRAALLYVERSPAAAGLVSSPVQWAWSSARAHAAGTREGFLDLGPWSRHFTPESYKPLVEMHSESEPGRGRVLLHAAAASAERIGAGRHSARPGACEKILEAQSGVFNNL